MKKTFTLEFEGIESKVEFSTCTFIPACEESERVDGLYVHELDDEFHDGDGVIAEFDFPNDNDEAEALIINDYLETNCDVLETVEFTD